MRNCLVILTFISFFAAGCDSQDATPTSQEAVTSRNPGGQLTTIEWIEPSKDYGKINEGQKLAISFKFKNSGKKPLIIESVKPTCGCTVADYPQEPIPPGEEAEITGEFDSNGREGIQRKHITVRTNTEPAEQDVTFEVNVVAKPRSPQQQTEL